jgi:hypothetical protein
MGNQSRIATAYFAYLNDARANEIDAKGWGCEVGRAFLTAKAGAWNETNTHLLKKVATMAAADAEAVWMSLRNLDRPWPKNPNIECHIDNPRSMDVGDLVMWEDGIIERMAGNGFELLSPDARAAVIARLGAPAAFDIAAMKKQEVV